MRGHRATDGRLVAHRLQRDGTCEHIAMFAVLLRVAAAGIIFSGEGREPVQVSDRRHRKSGEMVFQTKLQNLPLHARVRGRLRARLHSVQKDIVFGIRNFFFFFIFFTDFTF